MNSEVTIEIVYSNLMTRGIFSVEEPDYRILEENIRLTEENKARRTQDDDLRTLEDEP